jgi:glucokinase
LFLISWQNKIGKNLAKEIMSGKGRVVKPVIGVDIGGTKIMTAIFSAEGNMLAREVCATLVNEGVSAVIERLYRAIGDILDSNNLTLAQLGGIGIACAGGVDTGRGIVVTPSPNLADWVDIPLADMLEKKLGFNAFIINDASAAALGEHRFGAGRGVKNLVLFTLGTGIGGGIIVDDKVYLGASGGAGELGHITIDADGPVCGCGNTGCLEMLASGRAVARDAVGRLKKGEHSVLLDMVNGEVENITAEHVGEAARKGDSLAIAVLERAAFYLGIGIVNAVNIFNPEMVVIGGGMAGLGDIFIESGRRMVDERTFSINARAVRIVTAQLGNEAGVYGAAAFTLEHIAGGQYEST